MSTGFRILSAAAAASLFLPTTLGAQERPTYELPSITVTAPSESNPLYESAVALYEAGEWEEAAELYRDAAEGMPENDPNSYLTYDQSARLYFYAGEFGEARSMMEHAAGVAEATGDMVSAAYRHSSPCGRAIPGNVGSTWKRPSSTPWTMSSRLRTLRRSRH